MKQKIKVQYNGRYPNLCSGRLTVTVGVTIFVFPLYCLVSGGSAGCTGNGEEYCEEGPWSMDKWPINFPDEHKKATLEAINSSIEHGCCGGCI